MFTAIQPKVVNGYPTASVRYRLLFGAVALLLLCHCAPSTSHTSSEPQEQAISRELKAHQDAFAARNPEVVIQHGGLRMAVRMAAKQTVPPDQSPLAAALSAEGVGSAALGLAVPTIYSSALVVGGVLLFPGGAYLYYHEKKIWKAIGGAMRQSEVTGDIARALHEHTTTLFADGRAPDLTMEIIVDTFGLIKSQYGFHHCLVLSAVCIISRGGHQILRDHLTIAEVNRSEDAPPPQCAHLERFADQDARLLRVHLTEMMQVVAAMAVQRLKARSR